ncbi:uncharacterized protein J3D65DRAFT_605206 [Phyllosticta citribraziliensis]|uniref:Uncharacterized protein n=1 Tax=Phyllosticta citribraziliensis TaxID=989973 RepID=A0ABR1LKA5_9PEZI
MACVAYCGRHGELIACCGFAAAATAAATAASKAQEQYPVGLRRRVAIYAGRYFKPGGRKEKKAWAKFIALAVCLQCCYFKHVKRPAARPTTASSLHYLPQSTDDSVEDGGGHADLVAGVVNGLTGVRGNWESE